MNKKTFKTFKEELNPFAYLYAEMRNIIGELSTRKLNRLIKYKDKLDDTNCWWATYNVMPILEKMILQELKYRKYKKNNN